MTHNYRKPFWRFWVLHSNNGNQTIAFWVSWLLFRD